MELAQGPHRRQDGPGHESPDLWASDFLAHTRLGSWAVTITGVRGKARARQEKTLHAWA